MTAKIQVRRDTTTNWNAGTPPTLASGELGLDTDLNQLKAGNNTSPWNTLPWLGGTLPYFASPNSDLNDSTNRVAGRYRFTSAVTNGPASELAIVANDGGINMLVMVFGTTVVQQLWTDGDGGTQVPKSYSRVYDGDVPAWRPWTAQSLWGISATEGVDAAVRDFTVKRNATVEGTLSTQGSVNIGNGSGDVGVFQQGTVGNPSQTFAGDTDTGAYSPAANEYGIATNGARRVHITDAVTNITNNAKLDGTLEVAGALAALLNFGGFRAVNLAASTLLTDGLRWQDMLDRIAIVYGAATNGSRTASNGQTWTLSNIATGGVSATFTPPAGSWDGVAFSFDNNGALQSGLTRTQNNVTAISALQGNTQALLVVAIRRS
jgi:hypothetical protein